MPSGFLLLQNLCTSTILFYFCYLLSCANTHFYKNKLHTSLSQAKDCSLLPTAYFLTANIPYINVYDYVSNLSDSIILSSTFSNNNLNKILNIDPALSNKDIKTLRDFHHGVHFIHFT